MNKFMKVLAASALVATALVGCGSKAKYAKAGLGVVSTFKDGQVNTTFAAVGLDGDGKIQYIDIDVAQSTPGDTTGKEKTQTKKELKEGYNMKGASPIGKEWYEQIAAFEEHCKGKTLDEVAAIETEKKDDHHNAVPKAGSDLAAGCTMDVGTFKEAVAKAGANAKEVEAEKIGLGRLMANDGAKKQLNTNLALVATDADGKVVYSDIDVAQIKEGIVETKKERKEGYNMKVASPIGKEWYEQIAVFEETIKGKTADEIAKIETEQSPEHGTVAKAGTDLAAGCTMGIADFLTVVDQAIKGAQ